MWPSRHAEHQRIATELANARAALGLQGLPDQATIDTLAMQFVASLRREDYYRLVQSKPIGAHRADPNYPSFDPERAVAFHMQQGDVNEAGWLVFLMTHFARPLSGWQRLKDVYGQLGSGKWDWATVITNPTAFYNWLDANWQGIGGGFGNHRKYESLRPNAKRPMKKAVSDYLTWIGPGGHAAFFANAVREAGNDPHTIFDYLYQNLNVLTFGRLAKFDYLSLIGRYGIAPIKAGSAYLDGATGPGRGARQLIDGNPTSATSNANLQATLDALDQQLNVGMAVMEDALCNWQKSPRRFIHYVG
ncbi:hypothetical protein [Beijerinckia indica]|uniref:Alpha-glutamyl/putrescinyl thymine pyrophosphorylase clade 3 domain-containing protein n=1 Tax=Beijerinckia indica subsp. indica (strain ATCC 9039 / DSM 1715 / NCIMB 8712) TaxID=395963 RepID=B2IB93_BEII9|nr:hypothetical protein [Beijerinckia indica]ACB95177.1 conserved hypothetical protein [Beijerinckia indica subsp. indica ATCC 9039]